METPRRHVVVVGGGFGGLSVARALGGKRGVDVTLIDRRNHHLFQPLLYQVATAGLSPAEIAAPIRGILARHRNVRVLLGNVTDIDLTAKKLTFGATNLSYDALVLACGAKHSYFGHPEWEEYAPGLKTLEQATEIRRRILLAFELAETEIDPEIQKELLTFVIVGGGPTGVELAGAIAEISRTSLRRDFRRIRPERTRVILIEAGPRVLATFAESLSRRAARDLEGLGVQIWTSTRVTQVDGEGVTLGKERLRARTVIWAAGVQPSSLSRKLGITLDPSGRVPVNADLSLSGFPDVFVIGDQAYFPDRKGGSLPGVAPVAIQQGRHVAKMLLHPEKRGPFHYVDKGMMATVGRKRAVVESAGLKWGGFFAWITWLVVHIYYLIGFRNRLFVVMQWAWAYLTFRRGARLIVNKDWRSS
jgi:NADH dehydrogenase